MSETVFMSPQDRYKNHIILDQYAIASRSGKQPLPEFFEKTDGIYQFAVMNHALSFEPQYGVTTGHVCIKGGTMVLLDVTHIQNMIIAFQPTLSYTIEDGFKVHWNRRGKDSMITDRLYELFYYQLLMTISTIVGNFGGVSIASTMWNFTDPIGLIHTMAEMCLIRFDENDQMEFCGKVADDYMDHPEPSIDIKHFDDLITKYANISDVSFVYPDQTDTMKVHTPPEVDPNQKEEYPNGES